jgi:hypothetical protein
MSQAQAEEVRAVREATAEPAEVPMKATREQQVAEAEEVQAEEVQALMAPPEVPARTVAQVPPVSAVTMLQASEEVQYLLPILQATPAPTVVVAAAELHITSAAQEVPAAQGKIGLHLMAPEEEEAEVPTNRRARAVCTVVVVVATASSGLVRRVLKASLSSPTPRHRLRPATSRSRSPARR